MIAAEHALLRAVAAAADDDTPRLVYADWLEEHGDADRAEFIRVQCRLAELSPAEPEGVDLADREQELAARLDHRFAPRPPVLLRAPVPRPRHAPVPPRVPVLHRRPD
jgi:uncharacterized protein (TIGR02996 family)